MNIYACFDVQELIFSIDLCTQRERVQLPGRVGHGESDIRKQREPESEPALDRVNNSVLYFVIANRYLLPAWNTREFAGRAMKVLALWGKNPSFLGCNGGMIAERQGSCSLNKV